MCKSGKHEASTLAKQLKFGREAEGQMPGLPVLDLWNSLEFFRHFQNRNVK